MEAEWTLQHTTNINQMLRIKMNLSVDTSMKSLLIVKHRYHVADDVMFPDPSCLAFFTAFEENCLLNLEQKGEIQVVAVDIFEGLMQFYIYAQEAQKTLYDCIGFLKSNSNYPVDFEIKNDPLWKEYMALIK